MATIVSIALLWKHFFLMKCCFLLLTPSKLLLLLLGILAFSLKITRYIPYVLFEVLLKNFFKYAVLIFLEGAIQWCSVTFTLLYSYHHYLFPIFSITSTETIPIKQ